MASITVFSRRLDERYERGARGGPEFLTSVQRSDGGRVSTNQHRMHPLWSWDIGYGISKRDDFEEILDFHMDMRGGAYGFLFKNWLDYKITDEQIGIGDGSTQDFQLTKTYGSSNPYTRPITRPENDGRLDTLLVDGVTKTRTTHYTVNFNTGVIHFLTAPLDTLPIVVPTARFVLPVRFVNDKLELDIEWDDAAGIPSIIIEEVRE